MPFSRLKGGLRGFFHVLERSPILSFIVIVILLFAVIFTATKLRAPKEEAAQETLAPRTVSVFTVGTDSPSVPVQAEVKNSGILNIVAVTPGVVSRVFVVPGAPVRSGQAVLRLTNDYGANAGSIRTQIAAKNQNLTDETYSLNREVLRLQERVLHDANPLGHTRDIAADNLRIGKETLKNSREVSALNTALAAAENAPFTPRALANGVISSISVSVGDYVSPGTVLATIASANASTILEVKLPRAIAILFNPNGKNILHVDSMDYDLLPRFFSPTEDTNGLITLQFSVAPDVMKYLTDHSFVGVTLALESNADNATLVPLDALFQDRSGSSVLLLDENKKASVKAVTVQKIVGNFVLLQGLRAGDQLVTDRLTAPGDQVVPLTHN